MSVVLWVVSASQACARILTFSALGLFLIKVKRNELEGTFWIPLHSCLEFLSYSEHSIHWVPVWIKCLWRKHAESSANPHLHKYIYTHSQELHNNRVTTINRAFFASSFFLVQSFIVPLFQWGKRKNLLIFLQCIFIIDGRNKSLVIKIGGELGLLICGVKATRLPRSKFHGTQWGLLLSRHVWGCLWQCFHCYLLNIKQVGVWVGIGTAPAGMAVFSKTSGELQVGKS